MKTLLVFLISISTWANTVPSSWFSEKGESNKGSELKVIDSMEMITETQKEILESSESDSIFGGWKLSGQKTDIALSKSGILGLSSAKASSAVEINWVRKAKKENGKELNANQVLSSELSTEELMKEVEPTLEVALQKVSPKKKSKTRKILEERIKLIHTQVKDLEGVQANGWAPNKFRLNISVSQSGNVFWWSELSADVRVRLEWSIKPKASKVKTQNKVVQKVINDLAKSDYALAADNGFKLDKISVGLGLSKKNLFSLSRAKGEVVGQLFLVPTKKSKVVSKDNLGGDYEITEKDALLGKFFARKKLRKGLEKSFKIGNVFSKSMKEGKGKWMINKFKVAFSLSYSGFLGLSGTSSKAVYEIYYKR